ncbi:glycoside hydrolase family 18 protein [Streptomyces sp. MAR4 CNX-425]|uniref:glycoside hydrolase family 18 protein n=1 Tax=Streptomyces sp. MAR4 CNX-425 TaxID=3406343 RepID=UPI003B513DC7
MHRRLVRRLAVAGCALSLLVTPGLTTAGASAATPDDAAAAPAAERHGGKGGGHHHGDRDEARRVGYFTQWGARDRDFLVKDLVTSGTAKRLTHLNYAFGNVSPDGKCFEANLGDEGDAYTDYQRPMTAAESVDGRADKPRQRLAGNFNQLRKLKRMYPDLKVMMSLGGWAWSTHFSDAVRTPESRREFVSSCLDLFIEGNLPRIDGKGGPGSAAGLFDGIDLDWEWPNYPGDVDTVYRPEDKENFTALVAEFRRQLDKAERGRHDRDRGRGHGHGHGHECDRDLLLTAFLPASSAAMDAGYETRKLFPHLDYATVQGYDLHGAWEKNTNQQSAIHSPDDSLEQVVDDWLERGAPRDKIVLGIPFYGRGWQGVEGGGDGFNQPAAGAAPGTWEAGFEDYKVLKEFAASGEYEVYRDRENGHAWLFDGNTFWTYDDPQVIAQKAEYIDDRDLGGAMVWSLDGDDDGELYRVLDRGLD